MLVTFIDILHVLICVFLILVVLLQQGKGGGMGSAFGGGAATQVFGGSGAGNLLTRATAVSAALFMITAVSLAFLGSDRDLKSRDQNRNKKKTEQGTARPKESAAPAPSAPTAPSASSTAR
jgi:preprotein translocase subunit SecG